METGLRIEPLHEGDISIVEEGVDDSVIDGVPEPATQYETSAKEAQRHPADLNLL